KGDRRVVSAPAGRELAEQVVVHLERLREATDARVARTQAEVARLERRTWTGIVIALSAAGGLARAATARTAFRPPRAGRRAPGGRHGRGRRRFLPRAHARGRPRRVRGAGPRLQRHGLAAAPAGRHEGGVLRHLLARAPLAVDLGARGGSSARRRGAGTA